MTAHTERPASDLALRFGTAAGGPAPTAEQRADTADLSALVLELAVGITELVPPGRNQSLALTALEDVHMRANRGIYNQDIATR
ncbi:hypothetical protein [Clavibacter sp. VKM Ac-2872]|uniref:Acb2/Tad1 domain-containing protein n=1 Tax=Clavibacter sp. VKM Ac-2872 TaxID=2783812 RepID=UPI00188BFEE1|nr:hypothetical protein [Clavibacter sp. VKM Ac-2872]MBF4625533.1 hypothetical protein [Clavibacter sp. VKM Ac-2872]